MTSLWVTHGHFSPAASQSGVQDHDATPGGRASAHVWGARFQHIPAESNSQDACRSAALAQLSLRRILMAVQVKSCTRAPLEAGSKYNWTVFLWLFSNWNQTSFVQHKLWIMDDMVLYFYIWGIIWFVFIDVFNNLTVIHYLKNKILAISYNNFFLLLKWSEC